MKISKKLLIVFAIVMFFAVFWKFSTLLYFPEANIYLKKGLVVKIWPQETLIHKFTAQRSNLSKVEVLLRSPGIKYKNGDKVEMKIADENCQKILHTGELKDSFFNIENLYEFKFNPISDSEKKEFCLMATFLPIKDSAKSLQFFKIGEEENQPYSIRPVYKNQNILQDIGELNQRISQYKPWFLKHYYLYAVSFLFLLLSFSLVIILILI